MIDFPASPTVGQQFSASGVTWVWDGVKWSAAGLGNAFLPTSGGTLTGALNATAGILTGGLSMQAAVAQPNAFWGDVGGNARWLVELGDGSTESGSNTGSNFVIIPYLDNGSAGPQALSINRATGQVTIASLAAPQAIGDNRIINGDTRIDQRNGGGAGTASGYTIDRWAYYPSQAGKGTWQRQASGFPAFPYALNFISSSAYTPLAADNFGFWQAIEADMVSDFAWGTSSAQPVTLSFWVWTSLAGTFSGAIQNYASTRCYPFSFSVPTASTWTKITVTIPGDTAGTWVMSGNAGSIWLIFDLGSGANFRGPAGAWATTSGSVYYTGVTGAVQVVAHNAATFNVTGVKLEIGSIATPYNRQSLSKSLADCQRYYYNGYVYGSSAAYVANAGWGVASYLPTTMRAIPTLVLGSTANNVNIGTPNANPLTTQAVYFNGTAPAAGGWAINMSFTASAEL